MTIAFGFFQVISTFNRLSLNWPTQYLLFFRYVSGFAFNHQWLAVKCWSTGPLSYSTQLLMSFSLPLVFGMVLICIMYLSGLIIAFNAVRQKCRGSAPRRRRRRGKKYQTKGGAVGRGTEQEPNSKDPEMGMKEGEAKRSLVYGVNTGFDSDDDENIDTNGMSTDGKEKPMMDKNSYKPLQERISDVVWKYTHAFTKILCLVHTYLVAQAMEIYSCRAREDGTLSFRLDMSVTCLEDDEWFEWKQLSDYALIGYGLGIPAFILLLLLIRWKGIFGWSLDNDEFRRKYGGVFTHYRRDAFFFEPIGMLHRSIIVILLTSPQGDDGVVAAASAIMLVILLYTALLGALDPYRGSGKLDLFAQLSLFFTLLCGGVGTLLAEREMPDYVHANYSGSGPVIDMNELPPYGSAQIMLYVGFLILVCGSFSMAGAVINDMLGACGRKQFARIEKKRKGNVVMMELFPRSHRALQSQMPSFSADLLEDFKIDLAKLKNIHDIYYNVASKSQRPKGKPKAQNDGKKA